MPPVRFFRKAFHSLRGIWKIKNAGTRRAGSPHFRYISKTDADSHDLSFYMNFPLSETIA